MEEPLRCLARGNEYMRLGNYEAAVKEFEAALRLHPEWDTAQHNLAVALRKATPEEWLKHHPEDDAARLRLWQHLMDHSQYGGALQHALLIRDASTREHCLAVIQEAQKTNKDVCTRLDEARRQTASADQWRSAIVALVTQFYEAHGRWPVSRDELMRFCAAAPNRGTAVEGFEFSFLSFELSPDNSLQLRYQLRRSASGLGEPSPMQTVVCRVGEVR
jgi:hypothetical protein